MSRLFSKCRQPYIALLYFLAAIIFTVYIKNPVFLATSLFCGLLSNTLMKNWQCFKAFFLLVPFFFFISFLNPLVSHWGNTVLFYVFGNQERPFTLEALVYGMNMGLMFLCMVVWFLSFSKIMTTEKFSYIFGRFFPAISLTITMTLRLIPFVSKRSREISEGRKAIGDASDISENSRQGNLKKIKAKVDEFSAVYSSTLEDGLFTAQSMENRGWNSGKRSSFLNYSFRFSDFILLIFLLGLCGIAIYCEAMGGSSMSFYPKITFSMLQNKYFLPEILSILGEMLLLTIFCRK